MLPFMCRCKYTLHNDSQSMGIEVPALVPRAGLFSLCSMSFDRSFVIYPTPHSPFAQSQILFGPEESCEGPWANALPDRGGRQRRLSKHRQEDDCSFKFEVSITRRANTA